jgi:chaperonin GroES
MSYPISPLNDRVVIDPLEAPDRTKSGLYIPDTAKDKPQRGTVVAVGPGLVVPEMLSAKTQTRYATEGRYPLTVKVGDTVLYPRYQGSEVEHDGKTLVIMPESHLLAVVAPEKEEASHAA